MESQPTIPGPGSFNLTTPLAVVRPKSRRSVAITPSRSGGFHRWKIATVQPDQIVQSFYRWRTAQILTTTCRQIRLTNSDQTDAANLQAEGDIGHGFHGWCTGTNDLEFIPFHPSSTKRLRHQQELQSSKIRAHASRVSHARRKGHQSANLTLDTVVDADSCDPSQPLPTDLSRDVVVEQVEITRSRLLSRATGDSFRLSEPAQPHSFLFGAPNPVSSLLGQGRFDPFNVFAVQDVKSHVHEILDHAIQDYWPVVATVPNTSSSVSPVCSAWFQSTMQSPMAFYCFASAASLHRAYLRNGREGTKEALLLRLSYKTQAIRFIQEELRKGGPPTDDLLVSILILAAHSPAPNGEFNPRQVTSKSPLATAQALDFFGSVSFGAAHLQALQKLLALRGGVDAVRMSGLAHVIAYGDLIQCTVKDEKPFASSKWVWPAATEADTKSMHSPFGASTITQEQEHLGLVMNQARAITDALEGYVRRRQRTSLAQNRQSDELIPIIHWRNAIQHKLLSLPRASGYLSRESAIYEAFRLATLIYSNMVIFPLPDCSGVQSRLAGQMRKALDGCIECPCWVEEPLTMLWLTVMGGTASTDGIDTPWFARQLRMICSDILQGSVSTWQACVEVLETYLWWHYVCDEPGRVFWVKALREVETQL